LTANSTLGVGLRHVLLLSRHQQALLVLLFEEHELHLVVLEGMVTLALGGVGHAPRLVE
jgi:hypothetical protein